MWLCYGVHITVWHSCLCTLSASAFIDSSLHQLDFFLEIFYGDLFLFFFDNALKISSPAHAPVTNYLVIAWAAACSIKMASIAW